MRVDLPARPRVFFLALRYGRVSVRLGFVRRQFAKEQDIFRAADTHLAAVLALFRPAEAVRLVVLAHDICHDRYHAEVLEAVLHIVRDAQRMERLDGRHSRSRRVAKEHAVFDVAREHPPGLQNLQEVR